MAIQREIWQDYIIKNLFKNNEFLKRSSDAGANVLSGKVVHIPQAGGLPNVEKNRSSLPASVTQRTDTEVTYNLDNYSTDPILITNAEQIELSYNKLDNVMKEHMSTLNQRIADDMLVKWSPSSASSIIRTTGDSVATHLTDTTGNRKRLTVADIRNAAKVLDKMDMPTQGRVMVMSADMYSQFMDELTATDKRDFSSTIECRHAGC
ncbi:hypothetical protein EBT16_01735 [bacterium]|nr:hypothetical protein [bacterium]